MASFETTGILKVKKETQVVSDKFSKREFVITTDTDTQYPQYISLQLIQDRCGLLDSFKEGDKLRVSFNLRGREWSGPEGLRYFNSLEAWRLEKIEDGTSTDATGTPVIQRQPEKSPEVMPSTEIADDLPF